MKKHILLLIIICTGFHYRAQVSNTKHPYINIYYTEPLVHIALKETFSYKIKVNDLSIKSIKIPFNPSPFKRDGIRLDTLVLKNDGTQGDEIAGDSVFTINNLAMNSYNTNDKLGYWYLNSKEILYTFNNGQSLAFKEYIQLLVLWINDALVKIPEVKDYDQNIRAGEYVVSVKHSLKGNFPNFYKDDKEILSLFYKYFNDDRDFILIPVLFPSEQLGGSHTTIKNYVSGTGSKIFDNSWQFNSTGKLLGLVNIFYQFNNFGLINHELLHQWAVHTDQSLFLNRANDSHWGIIEMESTGFGNSDIVKQILPIGDSLYYTIKNQTNDTKCSMLELYLMGLIPLDSVIFPLRALKNPVYTGKYEGNNLYKSKGIAEISKYDFLIKNGIRTPEFGAEKTKYNAAVIIPYHRLLSPTELAYFDVVARELEKTENSLNTGMTFYEMTHKKAELKTKINLNPYSDGSGNFINSSEIKIIKVSSEETSAENGKAENVLDGQLSTYWHTEWKNNLIAHPHYLEFDLGKEFLIDGFEYTARQDSYNGRIKNYEFYITNDLMNPGNPVIKSVFENTQSRQSIKFPAHSGRYIKLIALDEINNNKWSSCSEIKISGVSLTDNPNEPDKLKFRLEQNYPNPFNPTTRINYYVPSNTHVSLKIYDMLGREILTIVKGYKSAGYYSESFTPGNSFPSGVYFYRIITDSDTETRKMMFLK